MLSTELAFGQISMSQKQKDEFLNDLVLSFENEYLSQKKGEQIAAQLDSIIKGGAYSKLNEADIFVETLNRDLYRLTNDLHLTVHLNNPEPKKTSGADQSVKRPIIQKELIEDGMYYLKFDVFPRMNEQFEKEVEDLMESLAGSNTIIIDLRDNTGGSDETVNHLIGYFFDEKKKLATSYQWHKAPQEIWANPKPQSKALSKTKLIILVSQSTFSAAEIFTQRLQLHGRAVVIGERTPGGAHRAATYLMSDIFLLDWPYERSAHASTEQDLEGVGITPDYVIHYNNAKQIAIEFAKNGKAKVIDDITIPKKTAMVNDLIRALNSQSGSRFDRFIDKYVKADSQNQVSRTLIKYKTVWNNAKDGKVSNLHFLPGNNIRMFIETKHGTKQLKIIMDDHNKIKSILTR